MASLTLEYFFSNDDDFGSLKASVATEHFCGANNFSVQWQDLEDFASKLSHYPITLENPAACEWGYSTKVAGVLVTRIVIAPANARGDLIVSCNLADSDNPNIRCQAEFLTNYQEIGLFRDQLESILNRKGQKAFLTGRDFHPTALAHRL